MMTQLLSGEFCKRRYDTIPVKSASAKFISIPVTQKCQILCCDTLVSRKGVILLDQILLYSVFLIWIRKTAATTLTLNVFFFFGRLLTLWRRIPLHLLVIVA